ncbi:VTT domain-containing protein [Paraburkholderia sp. GAS42]|uniref:bifunctional DedA family/phosphatase PAP2 family protein n=1 Tax=Paraburkholderia sp. GAS42 TaxID=3035135 RepID=UPI003D25E652
MEHAYAHLLQLLAGHPAWTYVVVFLAAFLEAIAVIGTFVPGSTTMFLAGALVGTGSLHLGWLLTWAIAGAVAGDGTSFWLGNRYKDRIVQIWPFRKHPQVLEAGHRFFEKHGAKSVVFARFIGPLRAIVPVVAGMLGMAPTRFYAMNVLSAFLWAPAHILPGVAFGASVQLAGAVSFRLVVIILLLAGTVWLSARLARVLLLHANTWASAVGRRLAVWASHRKGSAGRLALRMLDAEQPAIGGIVAASLVVLLSGWLFFGVLEDVVSGDPLVRVDVSVYQFLQSVRTPWGDAVLSALAILGSTATLAALVVVSVLWIVLERRWHTLGYWLIAVVFSQLLIFAIQLAMHRGPPGLPASVAYVFPGNHVAVAVIVYGFLAFLLARRVSKLEGVFVVTTSAVIVVVVALAGLYFGRFWFSDAVGGAALAFVWVAIVALASMWRNPEAPPSRRLVPVVILLVMCASVVVQFNVNPVIPAPGAVRRPAPVLVTQAQWTDSLSRTLPCFRSDMAGEQGEPFTLQWSARIDQIRSQLRSRGWVEGADLSARSLLSLASPNVVAMALPVLPELNNGVPSSLVFTRPGNSRDERDVLRFWPSGYAVEGENGASPVPLWVGSLVHERLYRPSWPINILRADNRKGATLDARDEWVAGHGVVVADQVNCYGIPVALLVLHDE